MNIAEIILALQREAQAIIDRNKSEDFDGKVYAVAVWFKTFLDPDRVANIEKVEPSQNIATIVEFTAGDALDYLNRRDIPDVHPDKPALLRIATCFVLPLDSLPGFLASEVAA